MGKTSTNLAASRLFGENNREIIPSINFIASGLPQRYISSWMVSSQRKNTRIKNKRGTDKKEEKDGEAEGKKKAQMQQNEGGSCPEMRKA